MEDLFETPILLPTEVQTILSQFNDFEIEKGIQYADLIKLGQELAIYGYEFDFYLDCVPYNLRKITKNTNFMKTEIKKIRQKIEKDKKYWQSYGVFAIAIQLKNKNYYTIDALWQEAIDLYNEFLDSEWNDINKSELDCINKFMIQLN